MASKAFCHFALILIIGSTVSASSIVKRQADTDDVEERYANDDQPGRFQPIRDGDNRRRPNQFDFDQFGQNNGQSGQNGAQIDQNGGQFGQNDGQFGQNGGQFGQNGGQNGISGQGQNGGQTIQNQQAQQTSAAAAQRLQTCVRNCLTTSEYNPVCGSDGVNYMNQGRFECVNRCSGGQITLVRTGNC